MLASFHKIWYLFSMWLAYAFHPCFLFYFLLLLHSKLKLYFDRNTSYFIFWFKVQSNCEIHSKKKNSIYENCHMMSIQETFKKSNYCLFNTTDSTFKKKLEEEVSWKLKDTWHTCNLELTICLVAQCDSQNVSLLLQNQFYCVWFFYTLLPACVLLFRINFGWSSNS